MHYSVSAELSNFLIFRLVLIHWEQNILIIIYYRDLCSNTINYLDPQKFSLNSGFGPLCRQAQQQFSGENTEVETDTHKLVALQWQVLYYLEEFDTETFAV